MKRTYSESTALPNSAGVSSGSGVKRAHGDSIVNDDEEQPGTRARIPPLIASLHGVNASEDDEIDNGDGIPDEWLSSWYPETHVSQKMVIEAKRKEMERFNRLKVNLVVTRESMERGEEGKMISIKWVVTKIQKNTQLPKHVLWHASSTLETNVVSCLQEHPGLMAMRTVISRAMARCETGARRSIMLADVKTAFLYGDARGRRTWRVAT